MESSNEQPRLLSSNVHVQALSSLLDRDQGVSEFGTVAELRDWARGVLFAAFGEGSEQLAEREESPDFSVDLDLLSPRTIHFEVDALLCEALGVGQTALYTRAAERPAREKAARFRESVERRLRGEPIAYILGQQGFFSGTLVVSEAVLIPRPETELLVERALQYFSPESERFFLADIGTGSGAILWGVLHELKRRFGEEYLERGMAIAVDRSFQALRVARHNLSQLPVSFVCGDLLSGIMSMHPIFGENAKGSTVFVANLPYIPNSEVLPRSVVNYEPELALRGGERGTEVIERFIKELSQVRGEYRVVLEVGAGQAEEVAECLIRSGHQEIALTSDYRGILRIVEGRRVCA